MKETSHVDVGEGGLSGQKVEWLAAVVIHPSQGNVTRQAIPGEKDPCEMTTQRIGKWTPHLVAERECAERWAETWVSSWKGRIGVHRKRRKRSLWQLRVLTIADALSRWIMKD